MTSIETPVILQLPHVDDLPVDWSGVGDAPPQPPLANYSNTLMVVVLDESGSMEPKVDDVIGGYKTWLRDQQALPDSARLIFTVFNSRVTEVHGAIDIKNARPLAKKVTVGHHYYHPDGSTALYDAVLAGVERAEKERLVTERVLVLVMTDGQENASRATRDQILETIKGKEAQGIWTFAYIGANPKEWEDLGGHAGSTLHGGQNMKQDFQVMSKSTAMYRASAASATQDFYGQGFAGQPEGEQPQGGTDKA